MNCRQTTKKSNKFRPNFPVTCNPSVLEEESYSSEGKEEGEICTKYLFYKPRETEFLSVLPDTLSVCPPEFAHESTADSALRAWKISRLFASGLPGINQLRSRAGRKVISFV